MNKLFNAYSFFASTSINKSFNAYSSIASKSINCFKNYFILIDKKIVKEGYVNNRRIIPIIFNSLKIFLSRSFPICSQFVMQDVKEPLAKSLDSNSSFPLFTIFLIC